MVVPDVLEKTSAEVHVQLKEAVESIGSLCYQIQEV